MGGTTPLSLGHEHTISGTSSSSATAWNCRLCPSMVNVTVVGSPMSRTSSAAWWSASARQPSPDASIESAMPSKSAASRLPAPPPGADPSLQAMRPRRAAATVVVIRERI
jgi:hypothetical protein